MSWVIEAVNLTFWSHIKQTDGVLYSIQWNELGAWIASNHVQSKHQLPLIKLAAFNGPCEAANLVALYGIEAEHDTGTITPEVAAERLRAAGVRALIYTTPSHSPDAPRWRVLCPFTTPADPANMSDHLGRLADVLGHGVLAPESWTRGRRWYVGAVEGGEPVRHYYVEGAPLDTLTCLAIAPPPHGGGGGARRPLGDPALAAPSLGEAVRVLNMIEPNECDHPRWAKVSAFFRQSVHSHDPAGVIAPAFWEEWCARYWKNKAADNATCWRSFDRGTTGGWAALQREAGIVPELAAVTIAPAAPSMAVLAPTTNDGFALLARNNTSGAPSALAVVEQFAEWRTPVAYNEFTDEITITAPLSYAADQTAPRALTDADYTALICAFNANGEKPALATVISAIELYAKHRTFNPVTDYLNGLEWDGVARLDGWLTTYLGAENNEWAQLIGAKFLISMVARAMRPGCKVDTVLIIEGEQGLMKSTAAEILCGTEYFGDGLPDMHNKDALQYMSGKWLIEISELSAMRRSEVEDVKRFITAKVDKYRPAYGRNMVSHPRTCVFIGTTNATEYLKDDTGNRRFWPVRCGSIDLERLRCDRHMLLAEAVHCFRTGERWWLAGAENDLAATEQADRMEGHEWEAVIAERIAARPAGLPFTTKDIVEWVGLGTAALKDPSVTRTIKIIMEKLGYKKERPRRDEPGRPRIWAPVQHRSA